MACESAYSNEWILLFRNQFICIILVVDLLERKIILSVEYYIGDFDGCNNFEKLYVFLTP